MQPIIRATEKRVRAVEAKKFAAWKADQVARGAKILTNGELDAADERVRNPNR